jgi:hypothetical protein
LGEFESHPADCLFFSAILFRRFSSCCWAVTVPADATSSFLCEIRREIVAQAAPP